jgi:hypothetical protein
MQCSECKTEPSHLGEEQGTKSGTGLGIEAFRDLKSPTLIAMLPMGSYFYLRVINTLKTKRINFGKLIIFKNIAWSWISIFTQAVLPIIQIKTRLPIRKKTCGTFALFAKSKCRPYFMPV